MANLIFFLDKKVCMATLFLSVFFGGLSFFFKKCTNRFFEGMYCTSGRNRITLRCGFETFILESNECSEVSCSCRLQNTTGWLWKFIEIFFHYRKLTKKENKKQTAVFNAKICSESFLHTTSKKKYLKMK